MTKVEEIWKDIPGFENRYQASTFGNIKSLPKYRKLFNGGIYFTKEKILAPRISKKYGYYTIALYNNNIRGDFSIHRLILRTFNPRLDAPLLEVNHMDGNKLNNILSNLEWSTRAENMDHAGKTGLMPSGEKHFNYGKSGLDAIGSKRVINKKTGEISNLKQAAVKAGYSQTHMSSMLTGVRPNKTDFIYGA